MVPVLRNRIYKKHIKNQYDIEIAFLEGPITWLMSGKSRAKKYAWIHNDLVCVYEKESMKKKLSETAYQQYQKLLLALSDEDAVHRNTRGYLHGYPSAALPVHAEQYAPSGSLRDRYTFIHALTSAQQRARAGQVHYPRYEPKYSRRAAYDLLRYGYVHSVRVQSGGVRCVLCAHVHDGSHLLGSRNALPRMPALQRLQTCALRLNGRRNRNRAVRAYARRYALPQLVVAHLGLHKTAHPCRGYRGGVPAVQQPHKTHADTSSLLDGQEASGARNRAVEDATIIQPLMSTISH